MFYDRVWMAGKLGASALAKRFDTVAENLANLNTPGYKRKEVFFEEALRSVLRENDNSVDAPLSVTESSHIGVPETRSDRLKNFSAEEYIVENEEYRLDGNNVDPEIEMAKLAETRMAYNGVMNLLAKRAQMLKTAIGD